LAARRRAPAAMAPWIGELGQAGMTDSGVSVARILANNG